VFKLHVAVTRASVDAMKADLTKTLPDVKSSHRCEALARAFGFRTYATMRAATADTSEALVREADACVFAAYLAGHEFEVDTRLFHYAAARAAMEAVLASEPQLNPDGFGAGGPKRVNGIWETQAARAKRVEDARTKFMDETSVEEFLLALTFVSRLTPTKVINSRAGSYGLKHDAERQPCTFPDGRPLGHGYISNGAFIVAAVHAGFRFKTYEDARGLPSLNVAFNMSARSITKARAGSNVSNKPQRSNEATGGTQMAAH